jgi:YkoY family integral membrane protein
MIDQVFALSDAPRVFTLAFLELLLSADNAVVLAVLSLALPPSLRRKALLIGVLSAFFLRAAALLLITYLLQYPWIELVGALYLIYLSARYFIQKGKSISPQKSHSFWKTVVLIELLDLIFALDSIIAGVAFIDAARPKLWIVYTGGMIGLLGVRYAADLFRILLDRFPRLEASAYLMVGWIGIKLGASILYHPPPTPLFWLITACLFLLGFFRPRR